MCRLRPRSRGRKAVFARLVAFAHVARGLLRLVDAKVEGEGAKRPKPLSDEALRLTATMVGAIVLARLVDDARLADRILRVARASARPE